MNPESKPKILIIVGPNSSGKSELAVKLARKFNGEIISADSRQIYQDLNIGTGKVPGKWLNKTFPKHTRSCMFWKCFVYKNICHYCIDYVNPKKQYTAALYKSCAENAIENIIKQGKVPIVAGGTGFWIDAVINDFDLPKVKPDFKLRRELEKKSKDELFKILKKLNPVRAETIEKDNPRRLIRAIEIAGSVGKTTILKKKSPYDTLWIGIKLPEEKLKKRIHRRLLQRIKKGLIEEGKLLRKKGISWKRFYELGLEYKFVADYLLGKMELKNMILQLEKAIWQYARRQKVWFKKNKKIHWIQSYQEAEKIGQKFFF